MDASILPSSVSARARWLVLIAMTGSLSMILLDQTVVTVALPSMSRHLHMGASAQQWVVNAYVLSLAALVAFGGKLGDRIGRVTTFRLGVLLFFVASAACGLAPDASLLIGARVAQGVGAALMWPASSAIMVSTFDLRERGRAMAMYAGISQVFLAAGPMLGGLLTEWVTWRAVFWLNVPVGIAALAMVRVAHPDNTAQSGSRVSVTDLVLITGAISVLVLGVQQANQWGWGSAATIGCISAGLLGIAVFAWKQLRSHEPLLNVRLFQRRPFLGDATVMGLLQFGLLPVVLYSSIYAQNLLGYSPVVAGLAALPLVLPLTATAQLGGRWFDRAGVRSPVVTGLSVAAVGFLARAAATPSLNYWLGVPGLILMGVGLGLTLSPTNTDALNRSAAAERGQASGLIQTVRQLGGTLGVAIVGAVILALEGHSSGAAARQQAADAIAVGFLVAGAAVVLALLAGWGYLARGRQTAEIGNHPAAGLGPNTAVSGFDHRSASLAVLDEEGAQAGPVETPSVCR
jgi:EmrB/QacA subfamily drug resistance transporter